MSTNVVNKVPYLRDQREFPDDPKMLALEVDKTYVDVANGVNQRTIGIYPTNRAAITGNKWYIDGQVQQTIRKVFEGTTTADIPLGFKLEDIEGMVQGYGSYTDGTEWYGLLFASSTAITGQISFYIEVDPASTTTDIIKFVVDGAAPSLTQYYITIEWLSSI